MLLGLKISRGLRPPESSGCYDPDIWNVKQKDNGIEQNTPQCCDDYFKCS